MKQSYWVIEGGLTFFVDCKKCKKRFHVEQKSDPLVKTLLSFKCISKKNQADTFSNPPLFK